MPSSNPLWFGYYPGDRPMPKRPDQRFPTPQVDMSDMGLNAALDEAIKVVEAPGNFIEDLPKQVWEWIKDDFKQSLNVGASPATGMGGRELYQFGSEEVADVKGVYAQINLFDLATNPKKTIGKFVEKSLDPLNPFKAASTLEGEFFTDLATNAEVSMWRSLLNQNGNGQLPWSGYFRDTFSSTSSPINLSEHTVFARKEIDDAKTFETYVTPQGDTKYKSVAIEKEVDVYQQVAENHLNFVLGKKSVFTRNGSYRSFNDSVVEAVATELSQNRTTKLAQIFAADPNSADIETRVDTFLGEHKVLTHVANVDDGLGKLSKTMAKKGFTDQVTIGDIKANLTALDKSAEDTLKQIEDIKNNLANNPLAKRDFERGVRELEDHLKRTREFTALYVGRPDADMLGRFTQAEALNSQVAQLKSRFSSNRYGGGVQDRYLENIGRRYFEGQHSLLGLNYADPTNPNNPLLSNGYRSLGQLYDYNKQIFWQEAGRDISATIGKGKLADQFLWFGSFGDLYVGNRRIPLSEVGLIKDRIQMLTPGYWTRQVMDRTHSFGLVYNEKMKDRVLHPVFNKLPWIIKNEFTEDFDYKVGGVVAGHITAKFSGSGDLQNFHSIWSAAKNGQLVSSGTGATTTWVTDVALNDKAKLLLLNGDPLALDTLDPTLVGKQFVGITSDPAEFLASMARTRADLAQKLGLTVDQATGKILDTPENLAKLDAFYGQLQKRIDNRALLNPFKEKFGVLEIYAHKLSVAQQKIYTKLGLNKVAQSFAQFKTALAQRIANVVAKLGTKVLAKLGIAALGTATAGIGVVLAPIIEKLLQLTVAKVVDKSKELLRAIVKGDFTQALDNMMNDAMKATEKVITCGCFVPMFLVFAIFMMMANIIVSISPVDRAKSTSSSASAGTTVPPPTGNTGSGKFFKENCNTNNLTCASFPICHGANSYWGTTSPNQRCYYSIPIPGIVGSSRYGTSTSVYTSETGNPICAKGRPVYNPAPEITTYNSGSDYGYAADYIPNCTDVDKNIVYVPSLDGITTWQIVSSFKALSNRGCGVLMRGSGTTQTHTLVLLHLAYTGSNTCGGYSGSRTVGQAIGDLLTTSGGGPAGWTPHIHVELKSGGSVLKPEGAF